MHNNNFAAVHRAEKLFGTPDFVKSAEHVEPEQMNELPAEAFADPNNRNWPLHTKAACWISNADFWEKNMFNAQADPNVGRELLKAAKVHGILGEVKQVIEKVAADAAKYDSGLPDDAYALVYEHGAKQRHFPVVDTQTTKAAAENLFTNRFKLPLAMRKQAAAKIQSKCGEFDVPIEPNNPVFVYLTKAASTATPDLEQLREALRTRSLLLGDQSPHQDVRHYLSKLADSGNFDLTKAAAVLDAVDTQTGMYRYYGHGLDLPEELVPLHIEKVASAGSESVKLQTGTFITRDQLEKAGSAAFDVLPGYSDAVTKSGSFDIEAAMEILPTLPRDDARLFEYALSAANRVKT